MARHALRADGARHVHRLAQGCADRFSLQHDGAASSVDHAAIGDQRLPIGRHRIGRQHHLQVAIAGQVQRGRLASAQRDFAQRRADHTLVADARSQQGHVAARPGNDLSLVDDRSALALEDIAPGHEIVFGHAQRGSHKAGARIDHAGRRNRDAILVDQEHRAIRLQAARDFGGLIALDHIQRRRAGARLCERHRIALADAEGIPVHHGALAILPQHHAVGVWRGDADFAGAHDAARWHGLAIGRHWRHDRQGCGHQHRPGHVAPHARTTQDRLTSQNCTCALKKAWVSYRPLGLTRPRPNSPDRLALRQPARRPMP